MQAHGQGDSAAPCTLSSEKTVKRCSGYGVIGCVDKDEEKDG